MVGSEYFGYNEFMMEAKTQNSPTDDIPTLNAGATRTSTTSQKQVTELHLYSVALIITIR